MITTRIRRFSAVLSLTFLLVSASPMLAATRSRTTTPGAIEKIVRLFEQVKKIFHPGTLDDASGPKPVVYP